MQKHPLQMKLRQFVPALFVFVLVASLLASVGLREARWLGLLLVGSYLIANISATLVTARRAASPRMLLPLPLAFSVMHFSYGLGFIFGLLRFCNRWHEEPAALSQAGIRVQKETGA